MDLDKYCHIRDLMKMTARIGVCVLPLLIVVYMGTEKLKNVEAGTPAMIVDATPEPTIEDRTRSILHADLDKTWGHYEAGEYSEDMWKGVYAHVTGKWNVQAKGKGWGEFAWAPPGYNEPTQISANENDLQ